MLFFQCSLFFDVFSVLAETATDSLLNQRVYSFDLQVRKAVGVRVALEILHENIPDTYTQCRHYTSFLLGSVRKLWVVHLLVVLLAVLCAVLRAVVYWLCDLPRYDPCSHNSRLMMFQ